jgi:hypothetical protein
MPMGRMVIRDNAVWAKHIHDDDELVRRILALPQNAPITLRIDRTPVRFRKMRDGADGRPTPGLRPEPAFKSFWDEMQQRRGDVVEVSLDGRATAVDPYLASLEPLLDEWSSPEDAKAYDGL